MGSDGSIDARLQPLLTAMVQEGASDLFLVAGAPATIKRQGRFIPVEGGPLPAQTIQAFAYSVMRPSQVSEFEAYKECDLAFDMPPTGRFRANIHVQRGQVGMVVRSVPSSVRSIDELGLPEVLKKLAFLKRGLVLAVGAAGVGKTTTLAAMIDYRNQKSSGHILTVEDPIEYLHPHRRSLVTQREVGIDTQSYDEALRRAMRESPNVIMIGEIRDRSTMQHAVHYAQSGHLCFSTLHANNASQAIQRILNFFPESAHRELLLDLSLNLKAVVAQRLVSSLEGRLVPATEVLLQTPFVSDLIQKGAIDELKTAMARSGEPGMRSFDQSLYELHESGIISAEEAVAHADNRTDFTLKLRLAAGQRTGSGALSLQPEEHSSISPWNSR